MSCFKKIYIFLLKENQFLFLFFNLVRYNFIYLFTFLVRYHGTNRNPYNPKYSTGGSSSGSGSAIASGKSIQKPGVFLKLIWK